MSQALRDAQHAWQQRLGASRVHIGDKVPARFREDTSASHRDVPTVLSVSDAAEIPDLLRIAENYGVAIHPVSTGNNWGYGSAFAATNGATILDLSDLTAILDFDPELGVVTVEPGVTQGMLSEFLRARNHPYMVPVTGAGPNCSLLANALERGYGITPYADHFSAVTDIEAVLMDGSIYKSALSEAGTPELARLFKWGIGPYATGLFSQSGFGVVTRASILLAARPEHYQVCLFNLRSDDLLEKAVPRIRELLKSFPGTIGGINIMNQRRVLAMSAPYPSAENRNAQAVMPPELAADLGKKYGIAAWTGFVPMYGSRRVVKAVQTEIRQALRGTASRLVFLSPQKARWIAYMAGLLPGKMGERLGKTAATLNSALELVQGRPNETALQLAYWRSGKRDPMTGRNPGRDGCGLLWYAPLVPMRPDDVRRFAAFATKVLLEHGLEPLITFTSQGDRLFDSTIPLLFNLTDANAKDGAHRCLARLTAEGQRLGFYPYRLHVDAMTAHAEKHPCSERFISRLKEAVDPKNLLAPGRYR